MMVRILWLVPAFLLFASCDQPGNTPSSGNSVEQRSAAESGPVKGVDRSHKGTLAPTTLFADRDGGQVSLSTFRGAPLLVNLWATWCAPCVKELPTLDALSRSHRAAGDLTIIAVSEDSAPQASVVAFLKAHHIADLAPYHDPGMRLSGALGGQILPTSVLYDSQGKEIWRYIGDTNWMSAEAAKLIAEAK